MAPCPLGAWDKSPKVIFHFSYGGKYLIIQHNQKKKKKVENNKQSDINSNCYQVVPIIMECVEIEHHDRNEFVF